VFLQLELPVLELLGQELAVAYTRQVPKSRACLVGSLSSNSMALLRPSSLANSSTNLLPVHLQRRNRAEMQVLPYQPLVLKTLARPFAQVLEESACFHRKKQDWPRRYCYQKGSGCAKMLP
jgi:hypothetical protein